MPLKLLSCLSAASLPAACVLAAGWGWGSPAVPLASSHHRAPPCHPCHPCPPSIPRLAQADSLAAQVDAEFQAHMAAVEGQADAAMAACFGLLPRLYEIESMVGGRAGRGAWLDGATILKCWPAPSTSPLHALCSGIQPSPHARSPPPLPPPLSSSPPTPQVRVLQCVSSSVELLGDRLRPHLSTICAALPQVGGLGRRAGWPPGKSAAAGAHACTGGNHAETPACSLSLPPSLACPAGLASHQPARAAGRGRPGPPPLCPHLNSHAPAAAPGLGGGGRPGRRGAALPPAAARHQPRQAVPQPMWQQPVAMASSQP